MFSKEWFLYVFGRWIFLSGIAGALVQYLYSDIWGIPTIPAFLFNQFCLACIFWYVDKYIFKSHLKNIAEFFRFPRVRGKFNCEHEFAKIEEEFQDLKNNFKPGFQNIDSWVNEFWDLMHACEMMERILREQGYPLDKERERIIRENLARGLYKDKFPR